MNASTLQVNTFIKKGNWAHNSMILFTMSFDALSIIKTGSMLSAKPKGAFFTKSIMSSIPFWNAANNASPADFKEERILSDNIEVPCILLLDHSDLCPEICMVQKFLKRFPCRCRIVFREAQRTFAVWNYSVIQSIHLLQHLLFLSAKSSVTKQGFCATRNKFQIAHNLGQINVWCVCPR